MTPLVHAVPGTDSSEHRQKHEQAETAAVVARLLTTADEILEDWALTATELFEPDDAEVQKAQQALKDWQLIRPLLAAAPGMLIALRTLIDASDGLTSEIELASQHFDTTLLDRINPANGRLMDVTSAAEKILKGGAT